MAIRMPESESDHVHVVAMESGVGPEGIVTNLKLRSQSGNFSWVKVSGMWSLEDFNGLAETRYLDGRFHEIGLYRKQPGAPTLNLKVIKYWR